MRDEAIDPFPPKLGVPATAACYLALVVSGFAFGWREADAMFVFMLDMLLIWYGTIARVFYWAARDREDLDRGRALWLATAAIPSGAVFMMAPLAVFAALTNSGVSGDLPIILRWAEWMIERVSVTPSLWIAVGALAGLHLFLFLALFVFSAEWKEFEPSEAAQRPLVQLLLMFLFVSVGVFVIDRFDKWFEPVQGSSAALLLSLKVPIDVGILAWHVRSLAASRREHG